MSTIGTKKKWIFDILFLVFVLGLTFYGVFHDEDPRQLLHLLDLANGWYWMVGIGLVLLFVSCESLIIRLLLKDIGANPPKGHCLVYSFIGFFFSCITPAAGGGQPAQVYYMRKDGIHPGTAAPILVVVTICYKLVLVLYGVLVLLIRPYEIDLANDGAVIWCLVGWVLNVIIITAFFLLIFMPVQVERLARWFMNLSGRFIKSDRLDRLFGKVDRAFIKYHEVTECVRNNPKLFFIVILISIFQRTLMFSVTWLVLRSFGIAGSSLAGIICMQAMVSLGSDLLPLPGGSGANEALFMLLFEGLCGETLITPVLIATRGINYYGQLVICGLVTLLIGSRLGKRENS